MIPELDIAVYKSEDDARAEKPAFFLTISYNKGLFTVDGGAYNPDGTSTRQTGRMLDGDQYSIIFDHKKDGFKACACPLCAAGCAPGPEPGAPDADCEVENGPHQVTPERPGRCAATAPDGARCLYNLDHAYRHRFEGHYRFDREAYERLCRYPFEQDTSCNLPGGHPGAHDRIRNDVSRPKKRDRFYADAASQLRAVGIDQWLVQGLTKHEPATGVDDCVCGCKAYGQCDNRPCPHHAPVGEPDVWGSSGLDACMNCDHSRLSHIEAGNGRVGSCRYPDSCVEFIPLRGEIGI